MERFNTCDLREKEVINLCDGTRLGCPCDFEFNSCDGRIVSIIVPRSGGFLGIGRVNNLVIPWNKIECIGEDAILVKLTQGEIFPPDCQKKKKFR
jgi:YlmC/YmxH family sporulation protein